MDDDDDELDPVTRRLVTWPRPIVITYLLALLAVGGYAKFSSGESGRPGWLLVVAVVLGAPMIVSAVWRAVRWVNAHPVTEDEPR